MTIISNTGPLIALAKINKLALLAQLFNEVLIPPLVQRELLAKHSSETAHLDEAFNQFIKVTETPEFAPEVKIVTFPLDLGEQHAIALAYQLKQLIILDDRLGREAAQQLNLPVIGTVGLLIEAKNKKLIVSIQPLLNDIRQQGYWLSDSLIEIAIKLAGETNA